MGVVKWIGAGLGWGFGGAIGALIGLGIGSLVEALSSSSNKGNSTINRSRGNCTTSNDITVSLLVLTAAIMKADGKVLKSELNYVKNVLINTYGEKTST